MWHIAMPVEEPSTASRTDIQVSPLAPLQTSAGTSMMKVEPSPGTLSAQIRPPIISVNRCARVRPRPVPPKSRVVESSACENSLKISPSFSYGMPIPVSVTLNTNQSLAPRVSRCVYRVMVPFSVNLAALEIRLNRFWRIFVMSLCMTPRFSP